MPQTQGLREVRGGAPLEEPATCANCGGPHPANHTDCPQYRREVRNKRAGTVVLTTIIQRPPKPSQTSGPVTTNMVSAEAHATSLMAPANPASMMGGQRTKRGKGKRSTREDLPLPPAAATGQLTTSTLPASAIIGSESLRPALASGQPQQGPKTTPSPSIPLRRF